jgi:Flp pilus assembly pilin Flp
MRGFVRRLSADQRAATAIEYSLIVCLIGTAAIGALTQVGRSMGNVLNTVVNAMI